MKRKILGIMFFLSLAFLLGTVGALDCGNISCKQAIIQGLIGAIVLAASTYLLWLDEERYPRYNDEEDM